MLQSTPLSNIYGHGHIKKIWLLQTPKETESTIFLASSTSRNSAGSSGLGHETKQGAQFSVGNRSTRMPTPPSGLPIRPLVSSPACFNMAMARQTSLVTCVESLSPPTQMEQSRCLGRSSSPSLSGSSVKEENFCLDTGTEGLGLKAPCHDDANSAAKSQWDTSCQCGYQRTGDISSLITSKAGGFDGLHEFAPYIKASREDDGFLLEGCKNRKFSDNGSTTSADSSGFSKCNLRVFSNLEATTPCFVPFQLPKYLLEAGAKRFNAEAASKVGSTSGNLCSNGNALPSILNSEHRRGPLFETVEGGPGKEGGLYCTVLRTCSLCGTSKTPLWRSGPQGPKSLCNACGIRFKKVKRGSSEGVGCPIISTLSARPSPKASLKPVKREQDIPTNNTGTYFTKPLVTNCFTTQVVKKRGWLQQESNGQFGNQKCEVTGSSNESSLTWNLHSPSAASSPSVSHFERLSIAENSSAPDAVTGKDEKEAAVLLMYMSWGFVFA